LKDRQTKDLLLTVAERCAGKGLKVAVFSATCELSVKVAKKGLAGALFARVADKGLRAQAFSQAVR
jgi:hypothetical protein